LFIKIRRYREASSKIFQIILKHCDQVEKASIDEAYIDLSHAVIERIKTEKFEHLEANSLSSSFVVGTYLEEENANTEQNSGRFC
jgi:DNA polymerase eta